MPRRDSSSWTRKYITHQPLVATAISAKFLLTPPMMEQWVYASATNPLNAIPGPLIARWVNWRLKLAIISGRRMYYVHDLHQLYGGYVRISPTEVAVSDPEGFIQIHKVASGFTKSIWYKDLVGPPRWTLFTMVDAKDHGARRRLMARAFSKTYLRQNWEGIVRDKIRLTVTKMEEESEGVGKMNALKWWTLMTTDVATHLMFGESFHMIEQGKVSTNSSHELQMN